MRLEIETSLVTLDVQPGDIFEVVSVVPESGATRIALSRVYRPKPDKEPKALGVHVSDGVGTADRMG